MFDLIFQGNELKKTLKLDEQEIIIKQKQIKTLKQEYTGIEKQLKSELKAVQVCVSTSEKVFYYCC